MRAGLLALLLIGSASATPGAARDTLGIYGRWGAFRDAAPLRCFAIARPVRRSGVRSPAFASVASWPAQGVRNQVHVRLSGARHPRSRVTLSIGERRFELVAGNAAAWAPDRRTDIAIVSAMRSGRSMSVETLSAAGRPFADVYALHGAATAIDAAGLGCVERR